MAARDEGQRLEEGRSTVSILEGDQLIGCVGEEVEQIIIDRLQLLDSVSRSRPDDVLGLRDADRYELDARSTLDILH